MKHLLSAHAFAAMALLMPVAAVAQTPGQTGGGRPARQAATAPGAAPEELCTLEGRVLKAATNEPLSKASLTLTRAEPGRPGGGLPQSFSTSTDASGHFAMKDLEPGSYRLRARRNGFVTAEYGARRPASPGSALTLRRGQKIKDVEIKLVTQGVVTGRILDEDGESVASAMVQALRLQYANGKRQLTTAGVATTNDLGEYRIFGLAPAKYYVSVGFLTADSTSVDRSTKPSREDYVATYYPGTTDSASAVPLEVAAGTDARGVDVSIAKIRTISIRGRVNPPGATPLLYMAPRSMFGAMSLKMVRVDAKSEFEIRGVAPGAYSLTGSARQDGKTYSSSIPIDVGSSDIDGLIFTIGPGVTVTGRVRADGETKEDLSKAQVRLQAREMGLGSVMGSIGSALAGGVPGEVPGKLDSNLNFRIEDVSPDLYDVVIAGLPDGFYVKSVRLADADVLLSGLRVGSAAPEALDVVVSPRAGQIGGSVQNADTLQQAAGVTVALIPREAERRELPAFYRQGTPDQSGHFSFKNLPPGEYDVFAWEDVENGAWMDPDFMKPLEGKGEAVTVRESGDHAVQVKTRPAEAGGRQR